MPYNTVMVWDGPVVQLVRMPPCHGGGRGFESLPGRHPASVAQLVEQRTENPCVHSSILCWGTICGNSSVVEHLLAKEGVASSNLVFRSIFARRHSQAVRQRSAKPLSPVRFWVSPPLYCRGGGTGRRKGLKIPRVVIPVPVRFRSAAPLGA